MLIGVVAGGVGVTTTINLQYVPQFLWMDTPAYPTLFQLNVVDDGTPINLDATGMATVQMIGVYNNLSTGDRALLQIANGEIPKTKGVQLVVTNSNAAAFSIYGYSLNKGDTYVRYLPIPLLANSSNNIGKFAYLAMPSLAATDIVNVTYEGGHVQQFNREELLMYNTIYETGDGNPYYRLNNLRGNVKDVQLIVGAAQTVYKVDYQRAGNATIANRTY